MLSITRRLLAMFWMLFAWQFAEAQSPTTPAESLAQITSKIRIGAEFFLNRTDTKEFVFHQFRSMHDDGISIVRIFIIWDDIERQPGQWDFERYDWIYDAAQANGIKIAATLCSEDPPGWRDLTPFYHSRTNLNDPDIKKHAAEYLQHVVTRYRAHPAQGVWLLMNEPSLDYNFEPSTMRVFSEWLQHKYGTVDALNKRWFHPLQNFSDVKVTPDQWNPGWKDYYSFIDWKNFNVDNLCQHLEWIKAQIRALDPVHATHLNQPGLVQNMIAGNQDPWQEGKIVDFLGASIHPAWNFSDFKRSEFGLSFAYSLDVLRSAAGDRPWWVTELQAGPTIFTGGRPMNPTPADLTRWIWGSIGAGAKGIVYWLWSPRNIGNEGGEWGLIGLNGEATDRSAATKRIAETLQRLPDLNAAKAEPAHAAILYNRETLLLIQLDGKPQAKRGRMQEPLYSLYGCYRALYDAHVPVNFLDIASLKAGGAKQYDILYLPYSYALDDEAVGAIRDYVKNGGTVWADGLTAWKNEYGEVRPNIPGRLQDVFGLSVSDIDPVERPYSVTPANEEGGQSWRLPLTLQGAQVLLRGPQQQPFATTHRYGKGTAIFYTSAVSLAAFERPNATVENWIAAPAREKNAASAVRLTTGPSNCTFRVLDYSGGKFVVLSNWGEAGEATVALHGAYSGVNNVITGAALTAARHNGDTVVTFSMAPGETAVLRALSSR